MVEPKRVWRLPSRLTAFMLAALVTLLFGLIIDRYIIAAVAFAVVGTLWELGEYLRQRKRS